MKNQMFVLRQLHKESRTIINKVIGTSYRVDRNVKDYFPKIKDNHNLWGVLVGSNDNVYELSKTGFEYYVMTGSGETFEKIHLYEFPKPKP